MNNNNYITKAVTDGSLCPHPIITWRAA